MDVIAVYRYVALAQREGLSCAAAYGAYRKAGGTFTAGRFRRMWELEKVNPYRRNHSE